MEPITRENEYRYFACYSRTFIPVGHRSFGDLAQMSGNRNPAHGRVFSKVAVTFTTESGSTVSSRFHSANPGMEMTTT